MPLRPTGAPRIRAPLWSPAASTPLIHNPFRICSSCRARLALRSFSAWALDRRRYRQLSDRPLDRHSFSFSSRYASTKTYSAEYHLLQKHPNASRASPPSPDLGGKPPRRLVILEMPSAPRNTKLTEHVPIDKDQMDILSQSLQTFEFQVSSDEVPNEIILFKPPQLRVSKSRFDQLFRELNAAFLGPQIKEYLGTGNPGYDVRKIKKKEAVNLVLRDVWKVEVAEEIAAEMDVIRDKELKFRQMDLFFMMVGGGEILQKLASRNRTRIILNSQTNTVVIKGSKISIEKVEKSLNDIPRRITEKEVDLSPLLRLGKINENYISAISRLTTTFLDKVADNKIRLYGTIPTGPTNILDAQRLLFNSIDLHFRETYSLLSETKATESMTGALYPFIEDQTLPWMYRGRNWFRWRAIRNARDMFKSDEQSQNHVIESSHEPPLLFPVKGANVNYSDIRPLLETPFQSDSTANPSSTTIPPNTETYTTYHAVLGQILHSSPTNPPPRTPQSLSTFLSTDPSHVLCNSVPQLTDFLSTLTPVTYTYDFKLLLKFSPSPWANPDTFETLPQVEMEIFLNPLTNEIRSVKISAIESHSYTDVLMPRNNCDLRFVRRRLTRVESATREVRDYIRAANLNVAGEGRLAAGEEVVLQVPRWMVGVNKSIETPASSGEENKSEEFSPEHISPLSPPESREDTIPLTYYFTGLESRTFTTFDWNGSPLIYTKVEAGTSGGSYDEVVLECKAEDIEYITPLEERRQREELTLQEDIRRGEEEADGLDSLLAWDGNIEEPTAGGEVNDEDVIKPAAETEVESKLANPFTDKDEITDEVFKRFVSSARGLVEAVEGVDKKKEGKRRL